jgi:hypothetical protein
MALAGAIALVAAGFRIHVARGESTAFFQSTEPQPGPATTTATVALEPVAEDATVKLRRLAQLRDAGVITEAEFQVKKDELLTQI